MPTYVCKCEVCGITQDFIQRVNDRDNTPMHCAVKTTRLGAFAIAPMVSAGVWTGHKGAHMPDGKNGGKGTWIESGTDWHRYMKQNGKVPSHEADQESVIQKANKESTNDKALTNSVEQAIQKHSS